MAAVLFWSARFTVTVICLRKGSQLRMFILLSAMVPSPLWLVVVLSRQRRRQGSEGGMREGASTLM
jgi:hypothetical protein